MNQLDWFRGPAIITAARLWWRLRRVILAPIAAALLLAGPGYAWARAAPDQLASELCILLLTLAGSWLGAGWTGALARELAAGREPTVAAGWAALRRAGPGFWAAFAARTVLVYLPFVPIVWLQSVTPAELEVGQANYLPLAMLLLIPLSANLGALFALGAPVAATEPGGARAVLERARRLGDQSFLALLTQGGLLLAVAFVGSIAVPAVGFYPNHLLGSLLWCLLAVCQLRAEHAVARAEARPTPGG